MSFAANAYARTAQSALSPREAEAAVLIKAARQLEAVRDNWNEAGGALNKALNFNQKVWTILATGVTEPDNLLPAAIKENIVGLSVFVFRRMFETLAEPKPENLTALININQQIAAGLRT